MADEISTKKTTAFGGTFVFTSTNPLDVLAIKDRIDAVAVKWGEDDGIGGKDGPDASVVKQLKNAGLKVYIWQQRSSPEGVDAANQLGADGYIGGAENDQELLATMTNIKQAHMPTAIVGFPEKWVNPPWPIPPDVTLMPEAYSNFYGPWTPTQRVADTLSIAPSNPVVPIIGLYNPSAEGNPGNMGHIDDYITTPGGLQNAHQQYGIDSMGMFSIEAMGSNNVSAINELQSDFFGNFSYPTGSSQYGSPNYQLPPSMVDPTQSPAQPTPRPVYPPPPYAAGPQSAGNPNPTYGSPTTGIDDAVVGVGNSFTQPVPSRPQPPTGTSNFVGNVGRAFDDDLGKPLTSSPPQASGPSRRPEEGFITRPVRPKPDRVDNVVKNIGNALDMPPLAAPSPAAPVTPSAPLAYQGGAAIKKVLHPNDGSTITITKTGAVIKESPGKGSNPYRIGWIDPNQIDKIDSMDDLKDKLAGGAKNPWTNPAPPYAAGVSGPSGNPNPTYGAPPVAGPAAPSPAASTFVPTPGGESGAPSGSGFEAGRYSSSGKPNKSSSSSSGDDGGSSSGGGGGPTAVIPPPPPPPDPSGLGALGPPEPPNPSHGHIL